MPLQIGEQAPAFSLFDTTKNKISLADYRDKKAVLLLFFPLAFTSVCTKELCSVRDDIARYQNDQVQVLGISVDSMYTLARYKAENNYSYPLLSDFNKEVSTQYDALYPSFSGMGLKGVSKRAAFLVDRNGILRYSEVLENASSMPDFQAINSAIANLGSN